MAKSNRYLKRKDAIAFIQLQPRVFDQLVRTGALRRTDRNGMECYEKAQLEGVRYKIDNPEKSKKLDWIQGILDGLSGNAT